jgi:hypothetical protein
VWWLNTYVSEDHVASVFRVEGLKTEAARHNNPENDLQYEAWFVSLNCLKELKICLVNHVLLNLDRKEFSLKMSQVPDIYHH